MMESLADEKYEARRIHMKQKMDRAVCDEYMTNTPETELFGDKNLLHVIMNEARYSTK